MDLLWSVRIHRGSGFCSASGAVVSDWRCLLNRTVAFYPGRGKVDQVPILLIGKKQGSGASGISLEICCQISIKCVTTVHRSCHESTALDSSLDKRMYVLQLMS